MAWSRRSAPCWPPRCLTHSRPRSWSCPRAAWSGGSRSGCRIGLGPRMGMLMACARTSTFPRRGGSSAMRWRRRPGSKRMRIRGCRSGRFGLCSRWWMGVWGSRGWRPWLRIWVVVARRRIRLGGLGGSARSGISLSGSIAMRYIGRRWCAPGLGGGRGAPGRRGLAGRALAAVARPNLGAGSGRAG